MKNLEAKATPEDLAITTPKTNTAHRKCNNLANNQNPRKTLHGIFFGNIEEWLVHNNDLSLFFILAIFRHTSRSNTSTRSSMFLFSLFCKLKFIYAEVALT
jgi:hypothetical protein